MVIVIYANRPIIFTYLAEKLPLFSTFQYEIYAPSISCCRLKSVGEKGDLRSHARARTRVQPSKS